MPGRNQLAVFHCRVSANPPFERSFDKNLPIRQDLTIFMTKTYQKRKRKEGGLACASRNIHIGVQERSKVKFTLMARNDWL